MNEKRPQMKKWFEFDQRTLKRFSPVCFPYLPIYSSPLQLLFSQSLQVNFQGPKIFGPLGLGRDSLGPPRDRAKSDQVRGALIL